MSGGSLLPQSLTFEDEDGCEVRAGDQITKGFVNGAINEDMASLDELLNQLVDTDDAEEAKDNDEE